MGSRGNDNDQSIRSYHFIERIRKEIEERDVETESILELETHASSTDIEELE